MKALMVTPEDAMQLLLDRKWIECQPWTTDFRGPVVICAETNPKTAGTIPGKALCVVNLAYVEPFSEDHLEAAGMTRMPSKGQFAWTFDDLDWIEPFPIPDDAPVLGTGLFDLNGKLVNRIPADMESTHALRTYYEPLLTWSDAKHSEEETREWWEKEMEQF